MSTERHGHRPQPGESQPFHPLKGRRSQAGGGAGFVTVNDRLFAPLAGLNPNDVTQGGYSWLSMTDGGMTYHPGTDLNSGGSCNADEGAGVVAPLAGVVQSTLYAASGEGHHLWFEIDDPCCPGPTWMHLDHLQRIDVAVGQRVPAGGHLGTCGRTGGWDCAHLHTEFVKGRPQSFWMWPYGWSRAQVEDTYFQPAAWWNAATALVLAEGSQPIPPEGVALMTDWELTNYVLAQLYEWASIPFNPDGGIQKCWVAAMRAGHYPGRPRTDDRRYGEGEGTGWWAEFEHAVLLFNRDGTMSWTG
jgi:murein DD-endopeptidase MepM/ murein hydrolase activator NlpD